MTAARGIDPQILRSLFKSSDDNILTPSFASTVYGDTNMPDDTFSKSSPSICHVDDTPSLPTAGMPIVGRIYNIRSVSTGQFLAHDIFKTIHWLSDKDHRMAQWKCTSWQGFRGFQNVFNEKFLLQKDGEFCLSCRDTEQSKDTGFVIDPQRNGSIVLRQLKDSILYPIAIRQRPDGNKQELGRMNDADAVGYAFKFHEVI